VLQLERHQCGCERRWQPSLSFIALRAGLLVALLLTPHATAQSTGGATGQPTSPAGEKSTEGASEGSQKGAARPSNGDARPTLSIRLHGFTETREFASPKDDPNRIALGRLLLSRVDLSAEDATTSATIRALADAIGINISVKFDIDFVDDTPIFLELKQVDGRTALEAIIALAASSGGADATWQLRRGIVEIGSKPFLARSSGRRAEIYEIPDLTFDVPSFRSDDPAQGASMVRKGTMGGAFSGAVSHHPNPELLRRKSPSELAAFLMHTIVGQVESESWDPKPEGDGTKGTKAPPATTPSGGFSGNANSLTNADRNLDPGEGPLFVRGKWASMDYLSQKKSLIVTAPDFVHRGIGGYPPPLPVAGGPRVRVSDAPPAR
jgi:hypothetical protein